MQGDFSRAFNLDQKRGKDYRRVLLQQGRVLLDSDFNASIDAQDQLLRQVAQDFGCEAGSSDLGYLVTPGQLLAVFAPVAAIEPTTTGELQLIRDYSRKYLGRYPSLRVSAPAGGSGGTVTIPFRTAVSNSPGGNAAIALWLRAASATTVTVPGAVAGTGSINVPAQDDFARSLVQLDAPTEIQIALTAGAEIWIGLMETHIEAGLTPQFGLAEGRYLTQGLSVSTDGGPWPEVSFAASQGFSPTNLDIPDGGGFRNLELGDRLVAYLEVWERHMTGVEDPGMIEQALGGQQDTCTRTLTVGQVKLAPALGLDATDVLAAFGQRRRSDGTLTLNTAALVDNPDPCALPVSGGYTGGDHRLYRFEVHQGGSLADTIIKWSRNNGSELFPLLMLSTTAVEVPVTSPLKDGDLVEILSERIDLADANLALLHPTAAEFTAPTRSVGDLVRLRDEGIVNNGTRHRFSFRDRNDESVIVTLPALDRYGTPDPVKLKVRRWHGTIEPTVGADPFEVLLENGISVSLTGAFEVGDWWQYEARVEQDNFNGAWQATPHGPERLFAPLALLEFQGANEPLTLLAWLDERFPSLCSIDADSVAFDGDRLGSESDTVQEALEELWLQIRDCGEITVHPNDNLQDIFNAIPDGGNAKICLSPGTWNLNTTVMVANKGNLVISGAGFGTQLQSSTVDPVLVFSGCSSIKVRDLAISGGAAAKIGDGLRGAISFVDCDSISLEHAQVICGGSTSRRMSAIEVRTKPSNSSLTDVHISQCRVQTGQGQTGILIVNAGQVSVRDNEVESPEDKLAVADMLVDPVAVASIGRVFMNQISFGEGEEFAGLLETLKALGISTRNRVFSIGGSPRVIASFDGWNDELVTFSTHRELLRNSINIAEDAIRILDVRTWRDVFLANPIQLTDSTQQSRQGILRTKLKQLRSGLALNLFGGTSTVTIPSAQQGFFSPIRDEINRLNTITTGGQGIVIAGDRTPRFGSREPVANGLFIVGGNRAPDIQITNNRVIGFVQGIHVGMSERDGDRHLRSYNVHVANNTIQLRLPTLAQERHGIFVGHGHAVQVENNLVEVIWPSSRDWENLPPTDGIRLYGVYGPLLQVRQNHCIGVSTGIRVWARNAGKQEAHHNVTAAWSVADNSYTGLGTNKSLSATPSARF